MKLKTITINSSNLSHARGAVKRALRSRSTLKKRPTHFSAIISSPIGQLGYIVSNDQLITLTLVPEQQKEQPPTDKFSKQVAKELKAYFKNSEYSFNIAIQPQGTAFQQKVWRTLQTIPPGTTVTYGTLAKQLKSGPRAIGQACRTNPILLIVPCHRIVSSQGIGGYGGMHHGDLLDIKKWLLAHEKAITQ